MPATLCPARRADQSGGWVLVFCIWDRGTEWEIGTNTLDFFGNFARFLEIAARQNGQITNTSVIARDAGVARQTVQDYFEILIDTLIGYWHFPWKLKRTTKQVSHPKFYFFDPGVVRALSGRLPYPPTAEESGPLFECFVLNEIRAYLHYTERDYPVY